MFTLFARIVFKLKLLYFKALSAVSLYIRSLAALYQKLIKESLGGSIRRRLHTTKALLQISYLE